MAKRSITGDLRQGARIGAEQRLISLAEEAAAIHRAFPELRDRHEATDGHLAGRGLNLDAVSAGGCLPKAARSSERP